MKNKLRAFGRSLLLDVGLRGKLLFIFFLLLVLPLGAFTLYAFHRINTVIEEQTYSAAQKAFEDTHTAVEDLLGREVVACREVGCGVVPMDRGDRDWREAVGRLCCDLAREAEAVYRIQCGLAMRLK